MSSAKLMFNADFASSVPRSSGVVVNSWAVPFLRGSVKTRTVTFHELVDGFHRYTREFKAVLLPFMKLATKTVGG